MKNTHGLTLLFVASFGLNLAVVDQSSWAEGGRGHGKERHEGHERRDDHERRGDDRDRGYEEHSYQDGDQAGFRREPYFNDQHRTIFREYYVDQYRSGNCPPGLAKKHNGCVPPGQARRWGIGRPLPRDVVYYDVPVGMIPPPPPGYRFVRVASDILMIAIGSGMVVDALTDLNGR